MIIYTYAVAGNLPIKTLVARQLQAIISCCYVMGYNLFAIA